MTLDEVLASCFPQGHEVAAVQGILTGRGRLATGDAVAVVGVAGRTALGVEAALQLSGAVLEILQRGGGEALLVLVDSDSQQIAKRDELLGLNEFLAHVAQCLLVAAASGHRTLGLLYGHSAAGAFIATALAAQTLAALPDAHPEVMDLPSMARVTKLPLEVLEVKARSTPVFAPGLANFAQTGALALSLDLARPLSDQLAELLRPPAGPAGHAGRAGDTRDTLGLARGGRPKAADIAARVYGLARDCA